MHKISLLALSFVLPLSSFGISTQMRNNNAAHMYSLRMHKEAALHAVAKRYISFLAQFGAAEQGNIQDAMESLFAPDCHKVINGKVVVRTKDQLYTQMANAKNMVGTWQVEIVNPVTMNIDTNTIVIHYHITTKMFGTVVVMKFLKVDSGYITEINEVYNMLDTVDDNFQQSQN